MAVCVTSLQQPPEPAIIADGQCVNVVDADTVDVRLSMTVRVRLLDAWAPEKFAKHGDQSEKARGLAAKARAKELIEGKSVRVTIPLRDALKDMLTLNRVLGRVGRLNDAGEVEFDLSEKIVAEGLATKTK
jgi:endonuclease YncB( thermonuclease family)